MTNDYFQHRSRFPNNAPGAFYTLGDITSDGTWCGQCLSCGAPENEAPTLLAPLSETNSDTYFVRQPETEEEIEQACRALEVCCVDALRYGGRDPRILARLRRTDSCDYSIGRDGIVTEPSLVNQSASAAISEPGKWWQLWKP